MAISNLVFYRIVPYNYLYREEDMNNYAKQSKEVYNKYKNNKDMLKFLLNFDYDLGRISNLISLNKIFETDQEVFDTIKQLHEYQLNALSKKLSKNMQFTENTPLLKKYILSIKETGYNDKFLNILLLFDKKGKAEESFDTILDITKTELQRNKKQVNGNPIRLSEYLVEDMLKIDENIFEDNKDYIKYIIDNLKPSNQIHIFLRDLITNETVKNNSLLLDRLLHLYEIYQPKAKDLEILINNYNEDIDRFIFDNINRDLIDIHNIMSIKFSALENEEILKSPEYQEYILSGSTWASMYMLHVALEIPEIRNDKEILEMIKSAPSFWCKEQLILACLNEKILTNKDILNDIYRHIPNPIEMQKERLKYGKTEFDEKLKAQQKILSRISTFDHHPDPNDLPTYNCKIKNYYKNQT